MGSWGLWRVLLLCAWCGRLGWAADGDVRLVNKASSREGIVEVSYNGEWGVICDDQWDEMDAMVVCRALGFERDAAEAVLDAEKEFGLRDGSVQLQSVSCNGAESDLGTCVHATWGSGTCAGIVGVRCVGNAIEDASGEEEGALRLYGGSESEGLVQVVSGGEWRNVCDEGWDSRDALVVCATLAQPATRATALRQGAKSYGNGNSVGFGIGKVQCEGDEASFEDCSSSVAKTCSSLQAVAAVRCKGAMVDGTDTSLALNGDVRIVPQDGDEKYHGRVEVYWEGEWRMVCNDAWTDNDAEVVCRQLEYGTVNAVALSGSATLGFTTAGFWLDGVQCSGSESRLEQCEHAPWGKHDCKAHIEAAGVKCGGAYSALGFWAYFSIFLAGMVCLCCVAAFFWGRHILDQEQQVARIEEQKGMENFFKGGSRGGASPDGALAPLHVDSHSPPTPAPVRRTRSRSLSDGSRRGKSRSRRHSGSSSGSKHRHESHHSEGHRSPTSVHSAHSGGDLGHSKRTHSLQSHTLSSKSRRKTTFDGAMDPERSGPPKKVNRKGFSRIPSRPKVTGGVQRGALAPPPSIDPIQEEEDEGGSALDEERPKRKRRKPRLTLSQSHHEIPPRSRGHSRERGRRTHRSVEPPRSSGHSRSKSSSRSHHKHRHHRHQHHELV